MKRKHINEIKRQRENNRKRDGESETVTRDGWRGLYFDSLGYLIMILHTNYGIMAVFTRVNRDILK